MTPEREAAIRAHLARVTTSLGGLHQEAIRDLIAEVERLRRCARQLHSDVKEAEAKQKVDERQCDMMTSDAGGMAVKLSHMLPVVEAADDWHRLAREGEAYSARFDRLREAVDVYRKVRDKA